MCGITGFIGPYSEKHLQLMTDSIEHRGPDASGFFFEENIGLGHRRLSIIDLAGGQQPIYNEDRSLVLIYNGEVYNFKHLRKDLQNKGHQFKSNTDSEVIIHLYEEYGSKCVDHLRGMFAFAIWDRKRKYLFLTRDRFGIKPLYYWSQNGNFVFASEIKALLKIPDLKREINLDYVDQYFNFRYVPGRNTMFKNIYKLEPGNNLVWENGRFAIEQYWDINFEQNDKLISDEVEAAEYLNDILKESINLRLISDVPLGAYLSGGLDSSYMVGLMSQVSEKPVETFAISFDDSSLDESKYSDLVSGYFKTIHHKLIAKSKAIDLLKTVIWHLDEPLADAATIPTYMMSKLTRDFVTVVLSGEGADELLMGYDKYKVLYYGDKFKPFVPTTFTGLWSKLNKSNIHYARFHDYLKYAKKDFPQAYINLTSVFSKDEKNHLYHDTLKSSFAHDNSSYKIVKDCLNRFESMKNNLLYLDIKTWLPNDVLLKNDKMTMANSIEARVPFLDHVFAEAMSRIHPNLKLKKLSEKYVLRKAMSPIVPETIVKRRKHGFTVPIQKWMDGALYNYSRKILSRENVEKRGVLNYQYVSDLYRKDLNNIYYRRQFWSVLTFELWAQIFIDEC